MAIPYGYHCSHCLSSSICSSRSDQLGLHSKPRFLNSKRVKGMLKSDSRRIRVRRRRSARYLWRLTWIVPINWTARTRETISMTLFWVLTILFAHPSAVHRSQDSTTCNSKKVICPKAISNSKWILRVTRANNQLPIVITPPHLLFERLQYRRLAKPPKKSTNGN